MSVRVRVLSTFAGPDGITGQEGDVLVLDDGKANELIEAGAAREIEEAEGPPAPGTLTMAGSFGGTAAPLSESGQTPGVAAPAPDPLMPAEAHADGQAVGAEGESAVEPTVNKEAIEEAAAKSPPPAPEFDADRLGDDAGTVADKDADATAHKPHGKGKGKS